MSKLSLNLHLLNTAALILLKSIMKIVVINDCAFVGETLIKYLPEEFSVIHLKRSRSFFNKTFGITWRIFRTKGNLYHIHYLLQDCYFALKLRRHPLIGHAHGSDLRDAIHSKRWGWIVKYNLRNCDKVLVAQPTILNTAKEFNSSAEYFPIPYDPEIFYPKPLPKERKVKRVFLASPHDFRVKGTDKLLHALAEVEIPVKVKMIRYGRDVKRAEKLVKELKLDVKFVNKVPHNHMNELYWEADLVLGSFGIGQLDTVVIEAMACGRPVIHHILKRFYLSCPLNEFTEIGEVVEVISRLLTDRKRAEAIVRRQLEYVTAHHKAPPLANRLLKIYYSLVSRLI